MGIAVLLTSSSFIAFVAISRFQESPSKATQDKTWTKDIETHKPAPLPTHTPWNNYPLEKPPTAGPETKPRIS